MKRTPGKLLAVILTLALMLGLQAGLSGGSLVYAADTDYGLIFDVSEGKFFLDDGADTEYTGQADKWIWDGGTDTLTLTDFEWETSAPIALRITDAITLNIVGSNSFVSTYDDVLFTCGIFALYDLTITGVNDEGFLHATGGISNNDGSTGILASILTVNGGTVYAFAGSGDYCAGIACDEFKHLDGRVVAYSGFGTIESYGIFANDKIVVNDVILLEARGDTSALNMAPDTLPAAYNWWASTADTFERSGIGTKSSDEAYVWNANQKFVDITYAVSSEDECELMFDIAVGEFYIGLGNDILNPPRAKYTGQADKWEWNGNTKTLTLNGFTWSTKTFFALTIFGIGDMTINLIGENTFEVPEAPGHGMTVGILSINGNVTIKGSGTLNAKGGSTSIYTDIVSAGIIVSDGALKIESGTVNAKGGNVPGLSGGAGATDGVLISGGTLNATGSTAAGSSIGMETTDVTISGGTLNAAGGASAESYGVYYTGKLSITGSTLIASGHTSALNKAPDVSALSQYTYWTNTSVTAPSGSGTKYPGTAYTWNAGQKYVKITTETVTEPVPETPIVKPATPSTPKTGDDSNTFVLSISAMLSIAGIVAIAIWKKRCISDAIK